MNPFPPGLSNNGTGIAIPSSQIARLFGSSTLLSSPSSPSAIEEVTSPTAEPSLAPGSVIEASEDLDTVLSKIILGNSAQYALVLTTLV